ncbi:MAG: 7-carboxy-7-deazaguanine synthase [Acidobacteriota bacterium]
MIYQAYTVKEIFYTLQGEGAQSGRPAVFCRFTGCNLWSGREADRASATCSFCDTDFLGTDGPGGGRFDSAGQLAAAVAEKWPPADGDDPTTRPGRPLVVCTGGEPLLQLDSALVEALHERGFEIAVETNGTQQPPPGIDWICVSPKAGADLVLRHGNELKLVFPQPGAEPERFRDLDFEHFFLQPMDGPDAAHNTTLAVRYTLAHPHWRLSLQTHKLLGIP